MCSQAWPYEDAQNATASRVHLELTRLLYAYCAIESITRAMDPSYSDDGKLGKHAGPILKRFTDSPPYHYLCTIDHIYDHCKSDPLLRLNGKLERSFNISDGKAKLPLQVGIQLRHLLAHGIFHLPPPDATDNGWAVGGKRMACIAENGTSSLLMAAQMMIFVALSEGRVTYSEEEIELDEPFPNGENEDDWITSITPGEYLISSHVNLYGEL